MNYLLDTHTFLWFINDDPALSNTAKTLVENAENTIYLSIVSIWEIAIKVSLGRLEIPTPFAQFIDVQLHENSILLLGIETSHTGLVATLPFHHRDPFDRLLIAQSMAENFTIIGKDVAFDDYDVERVW
jgi:PIN domain nuclease of toxin-antitoxin system